MGKATEVSESAAGETASSLETGGIENLYADLHDPANKEFLDGSPVVAGSEGKETKADKSAGSSSEGKEEGSRASGDVEGEELASFMTGRGDKAKRHSVGLGEGMLHPREAIAMIERAAEQRYEAMQERMQGTIDRLSTQLGSPGAPSSGPLPPATGASTPSGSQEDKSLNSVFQPFIDKAAQMDEETGGSGFKDLVSGLTGAIAGVFEKQEDRFAQISREQQLLAPPEAAQIARINNDVETYLEGAGIDAIGPRDVLQHVLDAESELLRSGVSKEALHSNVALQQQALVMGLHQAFSEAPRSAPASAAGEVESEDTGSGRQETKETRPAPPGSRSGGATPAKSREERIEDAWDRASSGGGGDDGEDALRILDKL